MLCGVTAAIFIAKQWQMGHLHLLRSTDTFKLGGEGRQKLPHGQVDILDNWSVKGGGKL